VSEPNEPAPSENTFMLDAIMDALIALANVGDGDFDSRVPVPEGADEAFEALFQGINEMIEALGAAKALSRQSEIELEERIATIEQQRAAIAELSTPVMEVWKGILCLPVVGVLDTARSAEMTETLLAAVVQRQTRCCIIDITGIEVMDTGTADHFMRMARAVRLLGADCVLTGINPHIAQTVAHMGLDLEGISLHRTLRDALRRYVGSAGRNGAQPVGAAPKRG
jgi:rsbT co-antagonist protein RsbR